MTHDEAFLQAIIENPADDTPRLIYADWLEEHGKPERAEFIRVQCELVRLLKADDLRPVTRRLELEARDRELLEERGGAYGQRDTLVGCSEDAEGRWLAGRGA